MYSAMPIFELFVRGGPWKVQAVHSLSLKRLSAQFNENSSIIDKKPWPFLSLNVLYKIVFDS